MKPMGAIASSSAYPRGLMMALARARPATTALNPRSEPGRDSVYSTSTKTVTTPN